MRRRGFHRTCAAPAVLFLVPMVWTSSSSVTGDGLGTYLFNTTVVAVVAMVSTVVTTTLGGYAMVRLAFPERNPLFLGS